MKPLNQSRRDLLSTLINYFWRLLSASLVLLLIPMFLNPEQQGYWYLFSSLSALSIFADLGFSNIVLQFSAHEFAFLHFSDEGLLAGDGLYLKKLGSLFRFVIKWISTVCAVVFPIIFVIGICFFIRDGVLKVYLLPWIVYTVGSLINFFNNSILSFVEGFNRIEIIQNIRFRVAVINSAIVALVLVLGGNIYALAIGILLSSSFIFFSIFGVFRKILGQLTNVSAGFYYPWRKEILSLFVKYALSVSSGYFLFHIYTPLMHYFHGPVYGGKVGISLSLVLATYNMSYIWMYTITPKMNMLISQKKWQELDNLYAKRTLYSLGSYLLMIGALFCFLVLFDRFWIIPKLTGRFLSSMPLTILFFCYFVQLFISCWALYLRAHKREPYVIPSVASAVWTMLATFFAGKYLSPSLFFLGFLSGYVWGTPVCYCIYRRCKKRWHEQ
jgi:O-antigen/teichoic acid export membrane protein